MLGWLEKHVRPILISLSVMVTNLESPQKFSYTIVDSLSHSQNNRKILDSLSSSLQPLRAPQFSSVAQSCLTLCDPMNRSTPGLPVHHQLPEFTQTHVHRVSDAIQPSHPLLSPSPPAPNPSQHEGLFQ